MNARRKIEIFSAGCAVCEETIELVNRVACPSCEISVLDMNQADVTQRARQLGIRSVPAVGLTANSPTAVPAEAGTRPRYAPKGSGTPRNR